ncbi:PREDICTED: probable serine/threonine-protein kinase NAK [Nicotiana attenuata]|uniref:non-specific serine/threonine protein kinase n=1 Tax=Nicotiana attenuata TaxID=49451 RepID=A0A314KTE5_NICAT|nr:PREDICTED: probable serine/threonine-protein kinase NAK [Nicotiana attenuata]OIT32590.1 putative serinethreonine-protein kinase cx32, chloroplastic [Nicotiana attenuata]
MGNCWTQSVENHSSSVQLSSPPAVVCNKKTDTPTMSSSSTSKDNIIGKQEEAEATSGKIVSPNLKVFSLAELKSATRNFRPDTVLGEGGFDRVFKGWVDKKTLAPSRVGVGMAVAVKKSNPDSQQGLKEWQAEVKFLGKFSHPNLVKLIGYCCEEKEFLLVYEHMQKGSLERHLFRKEGAETLLWDTRLKIVIGAARGLTFLHTTEKQVIYRDFKASNVLLDEDYNAKLSDFGLAKLGPVNGNSHVSTRVVGTYGYAAPEYVASGHLYVNSDVYGFGVVLLEIITGLRVLDLTRPTGQHDLVDWAKPLLPDKRKLRKMMDSKLQGRYPINAAFQIAQLILQCLESDPKTRPSMEQVLECLEQCTAMKMNKAMHSNEHWQRQSGDHRNNSYQSQQMPRHVEKTASGNVIGSRAHRSPINRTY